VGRTSGGRRRRHVRTHSHAPTPRNRWGPPATRPGLHPPGPYGAVVDGTIAASPAAFRLHQGKPSRPARSRRRRGRRGHRPARSAGSPPSPRCRSRAHRPAAAKRGRSRRHDPCKPSRVPAPPRRAIPTDLRTAIPASSIEAPTRAARSSACPLSRVTSEPTVQPSSPARLRPNGDVVDGTIPASPAAFRLHQGKPSRQPLCHVRQHSPACPSTTDATRERAQRSVRPAPVSPAPDVVGDQAPPPAQGPPSRGLPLVQSIGLELR
jgi:hypothetical protein